MNFTKITEEDLLNKGVFGLPDTPGLTTQEMQKKFDELSKDVIIPKFNALIEELGPIKSIERVSDSVEESDKSIPTGNAVKKLVNNKANELAKKPVYKSAGGFPEVGDVFTVYIDDTVSPRLLYTWDEKNGYVLTGGTGGKPSGDGVVLLETTSAEYEKLPDSEKLRADVQYFIPSADGNVIKYRGKTYGGGGDVDIDYSEIEFDTEEIVVENAKTEEKTYNITFNSGVRDDDSYIVKKGNVVYLHLHAFVDAGFKSRLNLGTIPNECYPKGTIRFACSGNTVQNGYLDCLCSGFIAGLDIVVGDYTTGTLKEVTFDTCYLCAN
jgi:hypothetical protein